MRQLEFNASIAEDDFKESPRTRPSSGWVVAVLVLAAGWVFGGVSLSPSAVEFTSLAVGIVGASEEVKLTNRGVGDWRPDRIALEGPAAQDFKVMGQCGVVLSGRSCMLEVQFHPEGPGKKRAELVVHTPDGKQIVTELSGTATPAAATPARVSVEVVVPPQRGKNRTDGWTSTQVKPPPKPQLIPAIQVDPRVLDFSSGRQQQQVHVSNVGTGALQIRVSLVGQDPGVFTTDAHACTGQIQPTRSCNVLVNFSSESRASKKTYNAQLDIEHNVPNVTAPSVALLWKRKGGGFWDKLKPELPDTAQRVLGSLVNNGGPSVTDPSKPQQPPQLVAPKPPVHLPPPSKGSTTQSLRSLDGPSK